MNTVLRAVLSLLDVLSIIYILDYITYCYSSRLMSSFSWALLYAHRWSVVRALITVYLVQRVGFLAWRRYSVHRQLRKKKNDLIDRRNRLGAKLRPFEPQGDNEEIDKLKRLSLSQLRQGMQDKRFTAINVIEAFQRDALMHCYVNPGSIADVVYDADVYSILADINFGGENNCTPLNGIPVAISEVFPIRGCDQTMGYVKQTCKMVEDDCTFVKQLHAVGAVPFLTTNFRQKILGLSAENPIYGAARHPTHPNRVCVGGEAVVVALKIAPLGFAADTLGESRLGAAFCGVSGFKPTAGRMSQKGLNMPIHFPNILEVIPSPIGRSVSEVIDVLTCLWRPEAFALDCNLYPSVYDGTVAEKLSDSKLCIGYFSGFSNLLSVSPPVERMMENCRQLLQSKGHRLVSFEIPEVERAFELVIALVSNVIQPDILRQVYQKGNGDMMVDSKSRILHLLYALPSSWRHALCRWRAKSTRSDYLISSLALRGMGTTKSYAELVDETLNYRNVFFNAWNEAQLDCLICPVSPIPAPVREVPFHVTTCCYLFTALFNLVGSPCGSLPMGAVEKTDVDSLEEEASPKLFTQQLKGSEGLPLGVQVVGRPWKDETVLAVMQMLEQARQSNPADLGIHS